MRFFIAIALLAAVASAYVLPANINVTPQELAELHEIMAAIHSPSTDPTTAAMLEQMLFEILGVPAVKPPLNLPAIIEGFEPPHASPVIIDFPLPEGAVEETPIAPAAPPAPAAAASPLVQIIVNVNQEAGAVSPVQVDHIEKPTPVDVVEKPEFVPPTPVEVVQKPEIVPTPVHIVDENLEVPELVIVSDLPGVVAMPDPVIIGELPEAVALPEPVIIGELPEAVALPEPVLVGQLPEAVIVSPIIVAPAVVGPEILN